MTQESETGKCLVKRTLVAGY